MILSLGMIMFSGISMEPHAYVEDPMQAEETTTIVVEEALLETEEVSETEEESISESETDTDETTVDETNNGVFSEDGNLTLTDDILTEQEGLQYLTVTTRNGNTFYMVIDRTADTNNVYFLNQVDETDLMSIMDENQISGYENTYEEETGLINNVTMETKETVLESVQTAPDTQKNESSMIPVIVGIIISIPVVGIGAYLFGKMNGERTKKSLEEDLQFYDDEEYVDEDQEEQASDIKRF